jgi:fluoride exporter
VRMVLVIAVAGALGALSRYGLESFVGRRTTGDFPWGTFIVNVSGAFAIGLVITLSTERWDMAPWFRSALTVGFLSSYTTFSALSFATYKLGADNSFGLAAANMLGTCAAGLAAVYLGVMLARI